MLCTLGGVNPQGPKHRKFQNVKNPSSIPTTVDSTHLFERDSIRFDWQSFLQLRISKAVCIVHIYAAYYQNGENSEKTYFLQQHLSVCDGQICWWGQTYCKKINKKVLCIKWGVFMYISKGGRSVSLSSVRTLSERKRGGGGKNSFLSSPSHNQDI